MIYTKVKPCYQHKLAVYSSMSLLNFGKLTGYQTNNLTT